jgi:hypothetical protein
LNKEKTNVLFITDSEKLNELFEKIKIGNASQFDGIPFVIPSIDIFDKHCETKLNKIEPNTILNIKNWKLKKAISFYDIYPMVNNTLFISPQTKVGKNGFAIA